jgi:hypothetical protein
MICPGLAYEVRLNIPNLSALRDGAASGPQSGAGASVAVVRRYE